MNILLVLIPVTMVIVIVAVAIFFWAVNHQQFDDLDSPGVLPLMEEPEASNKPQEDTATHEENERTKDD
jgi:cbb3-type cytochrome oxidase maturation protein